MLKIENITISNLKNGQLKKELPEFYELDKIIENNPWHSKESVFIHTINVLEGVNNFFKNYKNFKLKDYLNKKLDNYKRKDLLFLAAVFHDLGKKESIVKNGKISSCPKHEIISSLKAKSILKQFSLTKREQYIILGIIKNHSKLHEIVGNDKIKLESQFRILKNLNKDYIIELVIMVMTDTKSSYLKESTPQEYHYRMNFYKEKLEFLT